MIEDFEIYGEAHWLKECITIDKQDLLLQIMRLEIKTEYYKKKKVVATND
jgi:hypothetical protein